MKGETDIYKVNDQPELVGLALHDHHESGYGVYCGGLTEHTVAQLVFGAENVEQGLRHQCLELER